MQCPSFSTQAETKENKIKGKEKNKDSRLGHTFPLKFLFQSFLKSGFWQVV